MGATEELVNEGLTFHKIGQYEVALSCYKKALDLDPNQSDAHNLTADIHHRLGNNLKALYHANLAVSANRIAQFLNTRGMVFIGMRKFDEALADLKAAIKYEPKRLDTLNNLGIVYRSLKQYKKASECIDSALLMAPDFLDAWVTLGTIRQDTGDYDGALVAFQSALALDSQHLMATENITKLYYCMDNFAEVINFANKAELLGCKNLEIYFSWAHSLIQKNLLQDAANILFRGLEGKPDISYSNLETLLLNDIFFKVLHDCCQFFVAVVGNSDAALQMYDKSIQYAPKVAHALWVNRGSICFSLQLINESIRCNVEAIKSNPQQIWAYNNLGVSYIDQDDSKSAIEQFEKALTIQPNFAISLGWLLKEKGHICDWIGYEELKSKVHALKASGNTSAIAPFTALSVFTEPNDLLYWAKLSSDELFNPFIASTSLEIARPIPQIGRKFRIGYYSYDFRNHPVAHLTARLFEVHDQERFEIYAYSYGPDDGSSVRDRIKSKVTAFVDLKDMSVLESAQRIAQDEIDFLIDLTGNTLHTRSQVFALRPARIQAHWLGFVGTMGSNYYDYIIADDIVAPIGDEEYFSEKILRLKSGMHITDDTRIIISDHQDRKANGLPASGVVFGCFCQTFKIQPEIFSAWMRILSEVPNSVLWLASGPEGSIENLKLCSEHYQIDPGRIIVAQRCGIDEYLSRFTLMDVYLDTFPYTSGTVASDALYAGCPVVTLSGKTMVSRMAGSILTYAGFPELVTYSIDSYIKKAIFLANHPEELVKLKNKLFLRKQQKELFNTKKSADELEKMIIDMVTSQ